MKLLGVLLLIMLIIGCVESDKSVYPVDSEVEMRPPTGGLDKCSDQALSLALVDVDMIDYITPLGNLNPPEHTLPTQHMYIMLNSAGVELYSPGDLKVTGISSNEVLEEGKKDYGLTLALCEDVYIYFLHIKELSTELVSLLDGAECSSYGGKYGHCYKNLEKKEYYELSTGDYIGKVGSDDQTNFDFGAYDYRHKNEFVNLERYQSRGPYIVCPLDLYDGIVKEELYGLLELTREPKCGRINHDVAGTLNGNWFHGDVTTVSPDAWGNDLSFADNNRDFPAAMISVGGLFTNPGRWGFTPKHLGFVNRAFDEVTPDGGIYCYTGIDQTGRIIVQLESDTRLKIEHQEGGCGEGMAFGDPSYYSR